MKTRALIRYLQKLDPNAEVYIHLRANRLGKLLDSVISVDERVEEEGKLRTQVHLWGESLLKAPTKARVSTPPNKLRPKRKRA